MKGLITSRAYPELPGAVRQAEGFFHKLNYYAKEGDMHNKPIGSGGLSRCVHCDAPKIRELGKHPRTRREGCRKSSDGLHEYATVEVQPGWTSAEHEAQTTEQELRPEEMVEAILEEAEEDDEDDPWLHHYVD